MGRIQPFGGIFTAILTTILAIVVMFCTKQYKCHYLDKHRKTYLEILPIFIDKSSEFTDFSNKKIFR